MKIWSQFGLGWNAPRIYIFISMLQMFMLNDDMQKIQVNAKNRWQSMQKWKRNRKIYLQPGKEERRSGGEGGLGSSCLGVRDRIQWGGSEVFCCKITSAQVWTHRPTHKYYALEVTTRQFWPHAQPLHDLNILYTRKCNQTMLATTPVQY